MKGFDKLTNAITLKPTVVPAADPISLQTKAKPGPELYVRVARLNEQTGKLGGAAQNYQKALKIRPNYPGALLGYARLKDRTGDAAGANRLYRQAAKAHPKNAAVFNNLGLFQARHRMLDKAADSLAQAIRLQPKVVKYRNNLATLLVEKGRYKEAFMHLQVVHGEAVAYYNLGFLLEKKGEINKAALHYSVAARKNPALVESGQALARLQSTARRPQVPPAAGPQVPPSRVAPLPPAPRRAGLGVRQLPPAPSEHEQINRKPPRLTIPSYPQRLPPTSTRSSRNPAVAPLPQRSYRPPPIGSAPLPPPYRPAAVPSWPVR